MRKDLEVMNKREIVKYLQSVEHELYANVERYENKIADRERLNRASELTRALYDDALTRWVTVYKILKDLDIKPLDED